MAKKSVASIQTGGGKAHTKVIKMVKNERGSYSFNEQMVLNGEVKDWFAKGK
ncbi:DUF4295 domain-containing protein [Brumimicrobium glaciale]|jgi:hypothetical protein|uniref:DUF4295 domain-containing protein n=1 Tax=Brumimicrobium glaciale TaxID=200475 RepID=A0A4V1WFB2_9FLAO|nr:DUF4295 domain-containing protein [Brumimicrobium glaciale]RYM32586.1 DUF4295 domain-containing protein [Brumimicrobium glaciale]